MRRATGKRHHCPDTHTPRAVVVPLRKLCSNAGTSKFDFLGGRCYGASMGGEEGRGTTATDGQGAVAAAVAANQVEATESWIVVVASEM